MVYVRWYGKVLEGSVVRENDLMGLTAVSITVQGTAATALFSPGHIYAKPEDVPGEFPDKIPVPSPTSPVKMQQVEVERYIAEVFRNDAIKRFKKANWDEKNNHLRIDKLDEFYELWKKWSAQKSAGNAASTAAVVVERKRIVSDEQMVEMKERLKEAVKPRPRSVVQLSLF